MPKQAFAPLLKIKSLTGFTLIELVIVVTILAILAAIAIPVFGSLQTQARNSATRGAVMAIREAITQYRMNEIASGRSTGNGSGTAAGWPVFGQVTDRNCAAYDPALPHVMDNADLPDSPWAFIAGHVTPGNEDCAVFAPDIVPKGRVATGPFSEVGWRYKTATGEIWANSSENDGNGSLQDDNCAAGETTENCY